jgi:DNA-binding ferritin-like protein
MAPPKNINDVLLERLAEGLDSTSQLTHTLLNEIKESEADFATVKTELNILRENVKALSDVIRDGNGATSILTRMALIEQRISNIEKWLESHIDVHQNSQKDLSSIKDDVEAVSKKVGEIVGTVTEVKDKITEEEKRHRNSIDKELELQHEKKKSDQKVSEERQTAMIRLLVGLLIGIGGLIGTQLLQLPNCNGPRAATPEVRYIHVPMSSASTNASQHP